MSDAKLIMPGGVEHSDGATNKSSLDCLFPSSYQLPGSRVCGQSEIWNLLISHLLHSTELLDPQCKAILSIVVSPIRDGEHIAQFPNTLKWGTLVNGLGTQIVMVVNESPSRENLGELFIRHCPS